MDVLRRLTEQNVCARLAAGRRRTGVLWSVWTDQGALSTAADLWFRDVERFSGCYVLARLDSGEADPNQLEPLLKRGSEILEKAAQTIPSPDEF